MWLVTRITRLHLNMFNNEVTRDQALKITKGKQKESHF